MAFGFRGLFVGWKNRWGRATVVGWGTREGATIRGGMKERKWVGYKGFGPREGGGRVAYCH